MTVSPEQACTPVHPSVHPSREGARKVHGCTDECVSAGQTGSARCTGRCTGARDHEEGARPPYYVGGVPSGVHPQTTLRGWLDDLRRRRCTIQIQHGVITTTGLAARWDDRDHVDRHRHALTVAAEGTAPAWWAYVSGRTDQVPDLDDIPTAELDDDAFACACCGHPAATLDSDLLPWCPGHHLPDLEHERTAA